MVRVWYVYLQRADEDDDDDDDDDDVDDDDDDDDDVYDCAQVCGIIKIPDEYAYMTLMKPILFI